MHNIYFLILKLIYFHSHHTQTQIFSSSLSSGGHFAAGKIPTTSTIVKISVFLFLQIDEDIENDCSQDWFLGELFSSPHPKKSPLSQPSPFYPLNPKELFFSTPLNTIHLEYYKTIFKTSGEWGWLDLQYSCAYWDSHRCPEGWTRGFPLWKLCWFFPSWLCSSCALRIYFIKQSPSYQGWEGESVVPRTSSEL